MIFDFLKRKRKTVEEMLAELAPLGIELSSGIAVTDLFDDLQRERIEKEGYALLLAVLGGEKYNRETLELASVLTTSVWHFDVECIEDHGAYKAIVERACVITGRALNLAPIDDFVDVEAGKAWVEWTWQGARERMTLKVNDDWVDGAIFDELHDRLARTGSSKRYATHDLGQDCLIVCRDPLSLDALSQVTGLRFNLFRKGGVG